MLLYILLYDRRVCAGQSNTYPVRGYELLTMNGARGIPLGFFSSENTDPDDMVILGR